MSHFTQPTMYKFFCLKIERKAKIDSYMPCKAMAHSTKWKVMQLLFKGTGNMAFDSEN